MLSYDNFEIAIFFSKKIKTDWAHKDQTMQIFILKIDVTVKSIAIRNNHRYW